MDDGKKWAAPGVSVPAKMEDIVSANQRLQRKVNFMQNQIADLTNKLQDLDRITLQRDIAESKYEALLDVYAKLSVQVDTMIKNQ